MKEKCPKCEEREAQEEHTCPYLEEIGNSYEELCTCCEYCTQNCAMEV